MNKINFIKIPVILSVVFLVLSISLFVYLYSQIQDNETNSGQMKTAWQIEANRREDLKSLEKSILSIDKERVLLDTHFAKSSDVVPFLDMLDNLATSLGAKAEISLVSLPLDSSGLLVQVHATGNFNSVYKFLTLLENSPYEIQFTSMEMQKADNSDPKSKNSVWSISLGLKLLSFIK